MTLAGAFERLSALGQSSIPWRGAIACILSPALAAIAVIASVAATHAAPPTPVTIAVMYSSDRNRCFTPGVVTSIRHFTAQRAKQINDAGGIAGRPLQIQYFDDFATAQTTSRNVDAALRLPDLIGIVGMSSSTRGQGVVERVGSAGVPWISGMSRGDIYARFPTVFSMEPAVSDEIVAVRRFINAKKFKRPAFIGLDGDIYAASIADAIGGESEANASSGDGDDNANNTASAPLQTHWLKRNADYTLDDDAIEKTVTAIRKARADVVFLAVHSGGGAQFLRKLRKVANPPPAFVVLGRVSRIKRLLASERYPADMFELGREGVPEVYNERLQQRIWKNPNDQWIFDDVRNTKAPASCEKFIDPTPITDVRERKNRRAVGRGAQHGDALMLMAEAAKGAAADSDIAALRKTIAKGLAAHRTGQKMFRGWWQDWSFTQARAVAEQTLLIRQRSDETDITLAPRQYVPRSGDVLDVPVVYTAVDVVRLFRVDSNEKTFMAEFYLSFRTAGDVSLPDIEFTNAFRSPLSNEPVISARRIYAAEDNQGLQLWRITGKFTFDPELADYPFDRQRFSISFQPSKTTEPFFIQPPPTRLRKTEFKTDGWKSESAYVGSDQDIISVVGTRAGDRVILPLDKFNYTWIMKRKATDYYLQVIVPLIVILAVTWLSVFIPSERLESVVAIQVTALLSSIALYLAIPKVDYDRATVSDIVFVVTYTAISVMLGLSILRANLNARDAQRLATTVKIFQLALLPLIVLFMSEFILTQSAGDEASPLRNLLTLLTGSVTTRVL